MTTQPPVRATDREREDTVEALRAAFAAGCLDESELAERAGRAYVAVTREDLHQLVFDLPLESCGPGPLDPQVPPRRGPTHLGWRFGVMLAAAGAWMIAAALHSVVAVLFIVLWLIALRAWGWLPRPSRKTRESDKDGIYSQHDTFP